MTIEELKRITDSVGLTLITDDSPLYPGETDFLFMNGTYAEVYLEAEADIVADQIVNAYPQYFPYPETHNPIPFNCELDFVYRMSVLRDGLIAKYEVKADPDLCTYSDFLERMDRQCA